MTSGFHEYRDHIELAEQTNDTLIDWIEGDGSAEPTFHPAGPVADALTAMVRLFLMEEQVHDGRPIPQKRLNDQERRMRDTIAGLSLYPPDVRIVVAAPIAEIAESLFLGWIIPELLGTVASPEDFSGGDEPEAVQFAMDRLLATSVRMIVATEEWDSDFEEILMTLYDAWRNSKPDERLTSTLKTAVLFHAWNGRQELLVHKRRRLVEDEPLPDILAQALARMTKALDLTPMVPLCLHLALVEALEAGLVPKRTKPRVTVASIFLAWARFDAAEAAEEDRDDMLPDIPQLAQWARCSTMDVLDLSNHLMAVFDDRPWDELDFETRKHQMDRVYLSRYSLPAMPARWAPSDAWHRPGSVDAIAERRLEELRTVAWMMIDPVEPVLFVLNALPDDREIDDALVETVEQKAVAVWEEHKVMDLSELDDDDDDDDDDDFKRNSEDAPVKLPF